VGADVALLGLSFYGYFMNNCGLQTPTLCMCGGGFFGGGGLWESAGALRWLQYRVLNQSRY
jgi:hypothetical protein